MSTRISPDLIELLNLAHFTSSNGAPMQIPLGDMLETAMDIDPLNVLQGTADPSAGAGVVANAGDIYLRNAPGASGGELWIKVTDADTGWSKVNTIATMALATDHVFVGSAGGIATDVAVSSEASIVASGAVTLSNAAVIGKVLTGFVSGAGAVAATDTILQALNKIDGNDAAKLPTASFTDAAVTGKLITGFVSGAGTVAATDTVLQALDKLDGNVAAKLDSSAFTDAAVTGKLITGFVSGAGTVAATDTILQAINKIDGNDAAKLPTASFTDAAVTGKIITGFISGAGVVAATDTILQAIDKVDGNEIAHKGVNRNISVVGEVTTSDDRNVAGLASAIALCNSLQGHMNTHAADGGEHFHGGGATPDAVNFPVVGGPATGLASMLAKAGLLLTAYAAHNADAVTAGGGAYHNFQSGAHALVSAVTPATLAEAVARLNDLKAKYKAHYADAGLAGPGSEPHTASTGPDEAVADAANGFATTVADAAAQGGDKVQWSILDRGAATVKGVSAVPGTGAITFTFSADPASDTVLSYSLFRAN